MFLICEFEFVKEEDGYILCWPFFPGRVDGTQGKGYDDAVNMSRDWLRGIAFAYITRGEEIPTLPLRNEPQRGGEIVSVTVTI